MPCAVRSLGGGGFALFFIVCFIITEKSELVKLNMQKVFLLMTDFFIDKREKVW